MSVRDWLCVLRRETLEEMKEWLGATEDVWSDADVVKAIERHFHGGVVAFLADKR